MVPSISICRPSHQGGDKAANWLPTGTEAFAPYLRFYWPEEALIDGTWKLPTITKTN
jgi:hypothetical protein